MSNAIESKSVSLASIFDPYVAGTTKARATAIGDASNDTSNLYANIIYGSAAAATGIQSENADLNTLYAAKGTANYSLPMNGQTYGGSGSAASGLVTAFCSLQINNAGYNFSGGGTNHTTTNTTYGFPSGVSQYRVTTNGGTPGPWTALPSSGTYVNIASVTAQSTNQGTKENTITAKLDFGNNSAVVYTGTCTMNATADSGT